MKKQWLTGLVLAAGLVAVLAVVEHVDARVGLPLHGLLHRGPRRVEELSVVGLARVPGQQDREESEGPRQAARVRGQNAPS